MKKVIYLTSVLVTLVGIAVFASQNPTLDVTKLEHVKYIIGLIEGNIVETNKIGNHLIEIVMENPKKAKFIAYVTMDGEYLILGQLLNKDKTLITDQRLAELNKIIIDWNSIDKSKFAKVVKGNGKPELIVFLDPYCPHCHKALDWLETKDNYTLYIGAISLTPKSYEVIQKALCSKDPVIVFRNPSTVSDTTLNIESCPNISELIAYQGTTANKAKITGTPGFILSNGEVITGFIQNRLEKFLKEGK